MTKPALSLAIAMAAAVALISWTAAEAAPDTATGRGAIAPAAAKLQPHTCPYRQYVPAGHWGNSGTVLVGYTINADGTVGDVHIVESSGHEELDQAAVACASSGWLYRPATRNGVAVAVPWTVRITLKYR